MNLPILDDQTTTIEHLDFATPCVYKTGALECAEAAVWLLAMTCGCQQSLCDAHLKVTQKIFDEYITLCAVHDMISMCIAGVEPIGGAR